MIGFEDFLKNKRKLNKKKIVSVIVNNVIDLLNRNNIDFKSKIYACDEIYIYQNPNIKDSNIKNFLNDKKISNYYKHTWGKVKRDLMNELPDEFIINDASHAKERGEERLALEVFKKIIIPKNILKDDNIVEIKTNGLGQISKTMLRFNIDDDLFHHIVLSLNPIKNTTIEVKSNENKLITRNIKVLNAITLWNRIIGGNIIINKNGYSLKGNDVSIYGLKDTLVKDIRRVQFIKNFSKCKYSNDFNCTIEDFNKAKKFIKIFIESTNFDRKELLEKYFIPNNLIVDNAYISSLLSAMDSTINDILSIVNNKISSVSINKKIGEVAAQIINYSYGIKVDNNKITKETNDWDISPSVINTVYIKINSLNDIKDLINNEIEGKEDLVTKEKIKEISNLNKIRIDKANSEELKLIKNKIENFLNLKDDEKYHNIIAQNQYELTKVLDLINNRLDKSARQTSNNPKIERPNNPKIQKPNFKKKNKNESKLLSFGSFVFLL